MQVKLATLFPLCTLLLIALPSCTSKDTDTTAYTLALHLEPGMSWRIISTDTFETIWNQPGDELLAKGINTVTILARVTEVDENGRVLIQAELIRKKIDAHWEIAGQVHLSDTDLDRQYARIIQDFSFDVILHPTQEIEIRGDFATLHKRIREEIDFGSRIDEIPQGDTVKQAYIDVFIKGVSPASFKIVFSGIFGLSPSREISVGESWDLPVQKHLAKLVFEQVSLTLSETNDQFAYIDMESKLNPDPNHVGDSTSGEGTGELIVDLDTGVLYESMSTYRLRGTSTNTDGAPASHSRKIKEHLEVYPD